MSTLNLNFDTGVRTFTINNDPNRFIQINTTDLGILERLEKAQKNLEHLQKEAEIKQASNTDGLQYSILGEIDKAIREQINYIFGSDVSTPAFGTAYCFSTCNGSPIFENFLNALIPEIEKDVTVESKKTQANISKYTNQLPQLSK